jgi:hypothetical protein
MPRKLYSKSVRIRKIPKRYNRSIESMNQVVPEVPRFSSSFTFQMPNTYSVIFKKQKRFNQKQEIYNAKYIGTHQLPSTFSHRSAMITTSKKVSFPKYLMDNARIHPSSNKYNLQRSLINNRKGISFSTEKKFSSTRYIEGLKVKDIRVIEKEPGPNRYEIGRNMGMSKPNAFFTHKGKMFNEIESDLMFTPSP